MKPTNRPLSLGPLEQEVLSVIWQQTDDGAAVTTVLANLNLRPNHKPLAYTTVMTILNRLVDKGFLKRVKNGRLFLYQSANQRQPFLQDLIRKTLHSFANTFGDEAITAFAQEASKLTKSQKKIMKKKLS